MTWRPQVLLLLSGRAIDKAAAHGVSEEQMDEAAENGPLLRRNRKDGAGTHLVVGRDNRGQCIAIPVAATTTPNVWRAITAWPCKKSEEALLR
jgi:hypothetical protein